MDDWKNFKKCVGGGQGRDFLVLGVNVWGIVK